MVFTGGKILSLRLNLKLNLFQMKIKGLITSTILSAIILGSCGENSIKNAKMQNENDSLSYAFGIVNYNGLSQDSLDLNPVVIAKAMIDGKDGKPEMSNEIAQSYIMQFMQEREALLMEQQAERDRVTYKDYIAENEAFLAKNKERSGVSVTPSGLQYEVLTMGTGPKPTAESTVKVHYTGTLIDGTEFDSSIKRDQPAQFPLAGVIPGWIEGLQLMPVGSKFKLYLPENLGYGASGAGETIKPFSTLVFEVELLDIIK